MKKRTIGMKCYDGYNLDHWDLLPTNTSRTYYNGSVHTSYSCGDYTILGRLNKYHSNTQGVKCYIHYLIKFEDGTKEIVTNSNMSRGLVRNPNKPIVCNVGFMSQGIFNTSRHKKEYDVWHSMLSRCYDEKTLLRNPTYKDCSVDPRWHNFQNFCEDIQELEGYAEWKADSLLKGRAKYELDKDSKVQGNKVYSKDTSVFITKVQNLTEMCAREKQKYLTGKTYIGVRLADGYEEEFVNQALFAKTKGFDRRSICYAISVSGIHQGWQFKIKKENKPT